MIGETILHYNILKELGKGGMGVVYLAEDARLKRQVAIKFLPPQISSDKERKKRFELEAQAAASLNHPNISTVYAIEESGNGVFIVMEYIDGVELKDKIRTNPIPVEDALRIAIQIGEGLETAHKKGIVHRDIKPQNIMLTGNGKVKIMDFGLAKVAGGTQLTQVGSIMGTAAYMSPEQARGETIDQRTDIWALGLVMYEMLTGESPFKGEYEQAIMYAILYDELPELNGIPEELNRIIKKSTAKNPSDRYSTISEMRSDLMDLKGDTGLSVTSLRIRGSKSVSKHEISRSRPGWIWVSAASLLFVLIIAGWLYFNRTGNEQSETVSFRRMIVVLPFENLGSKDEDYFAEGITDEITSKLASIRKMGVISRSSAAKLVNSDKSTEEIGKELGVNFILSGTIRWAKGNNKMSRVRITPQLTRVSDNTITWSDSYDEVLDDIFNVQNDIARKVVDQLGGSLLAGQISQNAPTDNLEAYDFYLRGLSYESRASYVKSDLVNIIGLYKQAVKLDPEFALAYSHLSIVLSSMYWFFYDRSEKNVDDALFNAQKSLQLAPDLPDTYLALGYYYFWCKLDYDKSIGEFSKARELQPNSAKVFFALGVVYRRMGKFDLCIESILKGEKFDPLSGDYKRILGETYALLRDYRNAEKYYNKAIELTPDLSDLKAEMAYSSISWKGNTKTASRNMSEIKDNAYLDAMVNLPVLIDIYNRNYDKALSYLKPADFNYETDQFRFTPGSQVCGLLYKYKNEPELSRSYFDLSRIMLEKMIKANPRDERLHSSLGVTYAGLGLKEKAVYEGKKGIELLSLDKDAFRGYYRQWDMANIYVLIGDNENALKQLDFILSIPGTFTIVLLKLDPLYDKLRDLPGYKAIVQKYSEMYKNSNSKPEG